MKNTVIQDLIEWIDRVEDRGIKSLSTEKIRERIREHIPIEKSRLAEFHAAGQKGISFSDTYSIYKTPIVKPDDHEKTT